MSANKTTPETGRRSPVLRAAAIGLGILVSLAMVFVFLNSSPATAPQRYSARSLRTSDRLFSIAKGENLHRISQRLHAEGYIRFAPLLEAAGWILGTQGAFKAGYYRIPARATTLRIHNLLVTGAQSLVKVTIPEGWTIGKIARRLQALGVCSADEFIAAASSPSLRGKFGIPAVSLEGYLYPDTYFIPAPFPAETLAELMVKTFFEALGKIWPGWREMAPAELQAKVILASIVEREYRDADEAPLIASVFYNRLRLNIGLESCATLEYILTEIQQKAHPEYITAEDKKIDSPYNTYRWAGLPPGAISNPGSVALEAVFKPARTDYLYFVLRDPAAGRHQFSRDLNAHNQAKYLYLKKP